MPPVLIDTNMLIYLFDQNEPLKQSKSRKVLRYLAENRSGRLSVQNLSEFINAATRKLSPPMNIEKALLIVTQFVK